jgi:hypothetical protein
MNIGAKLEHFKKLQEYLEFHKDSVTKGMFLTRRPCGAKPQVKGEQGLASRPNPMADPPHFVSV